MANRKLRVLLKKIYSNGDIDTIFFRSRAKDVYVDDDGSTTLQDTVDKVNEMQDGATKVEESATNGNIKINGSETQVYKHPNSGATAGTYNKVTVNAEGHVTSGTNVTDWDGTVSGDISNATATFTQASTRENITTGSNVKTILGKIAKYFADLKSLAFVDKVGTANLDSTLTTAYNNRVTTDKVTTSTSINAAGWVADARAIATLQNQINTINSNMNSKMPLWTAIPYSNINNIADNGIYTITDSTVGLLIHENWNEDYAFQLFHQFSNDTFQWRVKRSNVWEGWKIPSLNGHTHSEFQTLSNEIQDVKKYFYSVSNSTSAGDRNLLIDERTSMHCIVSETTLNIIFPSGKSMMALVGVNRGASNDENGLILVCARNNRLFTSVIKSLPLACTYVTSNYTLGITTGSGVIGVVSIIC